MRDLKIVYGRNGSDLHRRMRAKAAEYAAASEPDGRAFFIVPDQYTLTAERFLLSALGEAAFHKVRVVSFKRLAALAFSECGKTFRSVGEGGRAALVASAFDAVSPQLKYYAGYSDFYFNEALCDRIKMFKEYAVTPDALLSADTSDAVRDIALVYGAYDAMLGPEKSDPADNLRLFAELIAERGLFRGTTVLIDFFKVLNASELSVVSALYEAGADVTVALVCDEKRDENGLFAPVNSVENKLRRAVAKYGGKLVYEKAEEGTEYRSHGLLRLENFLATDLTPDGGADCDGLEIYEAADVADEFDFVCCRICELVLDKGYRYGDIAVVTRDDEHCAAIAERVFAEYSVPMFRHKKSGLLEKKAVRFLSALFSAIRFGCRSVDVLDVLRCGFIDGVDSLSSAEFERYVLIWNVSGKGFFEPFERSIRGFDGGGTVSATDAARLESAENVRQRVCEVLSFLGKGSEKASVKEHAERLFGLFSQIGLEAKLEAETSALADMGEIVLAEENGKLFELLVRGLDEYVSASGESEVTLDLFGRMYLRIVSEYSVGSIPTALDAVLFGGADTAPLLEKRAVFVLGLREGAFPKTPSPTPLIPEKERAALEEQGVVVDLAPFEKALYEQYIAYSVLTSATDRVYMSYPVTDGGECVASEIFDACAKAFPNAVIAEKASSPSRIRRKRPSKTKAVEYGLPDLISYFGLKLADENDRLRAEYDITPELADRLYGKNITVSATSSDMFSKCPYEYFMTFGLGVRELKKAEFSAVNVGSCVHATLDAVFRKYGNIAAFTDSEILKTADEEVSGYMRSVFGKDAERPDMQICALAVRKRLITMMKAMRNELSVSGFRPAYTELGIGGDGDVLKCELDCGDGVTARVRGSIDRVDVMNDGGKSYVRVIDYKTKKKEFSLFDIYRGENVQLPLYLDVLTSTGEKLFDSRPLPAGMMYYGLDREFERIDRAMLLFEALDIFENSGELPSKPPFLDKRSGMILDDPEMLEKADKSEKYFRDKDEAKKFKFVSHGDFETVFRHVKRKLKEMCSSVSSGKIEKTPYFVIANCGYCHLKDVCENSKYVRPAERPKDILEQMRREGESENDG